MKTQAGGGHEWAEKGVGNECARCGARLFAGYCSHTYVVDGTSYVIPKGTAIPECPRVKECEA